MDESRESEYGFWFEQRHRTSGERRECIQELVEGANPTLGHIILARLMSEDYVPLTLTPNFDDPLYQFMEVRPHLVNHGAVTPWFKLMHDRPAIVKLHGDYLYDNLRNTDPETSTLSPGREEALRRTVTEYGLVVVGYGGADESIMARSSRPNSPSTASTGVRGIPTISTGSLRTAPDGRRLSGGDRRLREHDDAVRGAHRRRRPSDSGRTRGAGGEAGGPVQRDRRGIDGIGRRRGSGVRGETAVVRGGTRGLQ